MGFSDQSTVGVIQRWVEFVLMFVIFILLIAATATIDWLEAKTPIGTAYIGLYQACAGGETDNCDSWNHSTLQNCADNASGTLQSACSDLLEAQILMPVAIVISFIAVFIQLVISCSCNCCGCGSGLCIQRTGIVTILLNIITFCLTVVGWNDANTAMKDLGSIIDTSFISTSSGSSYKMAIVSWVLTLVLICAGVGLQFIRYREGSLIPQQEGAVPMQTVGVTTAFHSASPSSPVYATSAAPVYASSAAPVYTSSAPVYASSAAPVPSLPRRTHPKQTTSMDFQLESNNSLSPSPSLSPVNASSAAPVIPSDQVKFCIRCGNSLPLDAAFCSRCGATQ
jgi:hypothetical protein